MEKPVRDGRLIRIKIETNRLTWDDKITHKLTLTDVDGRTNFFVLKSETPITLSSFAPAPYLCDFITTYENYLFLYPPRREEQ